MILLDTVALVNLATGNHLSQNALREIEIAEASNLLYLSAISAWELCLLETNGRTRHLVRGDGAAFLARVRDRTSLQMVSIDESIAIESRRLPGDFHKDPADRFIVATARVHGMIVITGDKHILAYAALGHVRAVAC
jgi:PIN domain nuclease of toxin-antitoxin system